MPFEHVFDLVKVKHQETCIKKQLQSLCHKDLWLSSLLFQLFFYFLCLSYSLSLMVFFSSHNAYFLLLVMCVHSPIAFEGHCDSSMCCCTWETFFIFSTHCSQCTSVVNQFLANNSFLIFNPLFY